MKFLRGLKACGIVNAVQVVYLQAAPLLWSTVSCAGLMAFSRDQDVRYVNNFFFMEKGEKLSQTEH